MRKSSLLYLALVFIMLLAIFQFVATAFYFYWIFWWFDLMMHTLGGFCGAMVILWFTSTSRKTKSLTLTLVGLMFVAVLWEIFEYIYGIVPPGNYWQDTAFDLICDGVGAVLACIYAMKVRNRESV